MFRPSRSYRVFFFFFLLCSPLQFDLGGASTSDFHSCWEEDCGSDVKIFLSLSANWNVWRVSLKSTLKWLESESWVCKLGKKVTFHDSCVFGEDENGPQRLNFKIFMIVRVTSKHFSLSLWKSCYNSAYHFFLQTFFTYLEISDQISNSQMSLWHVLSYFWCT